MARTKAHHPIYVHRSLGNKAEERHDHRFSECDLPPLSVWLEEEDSEGISVWHKYSCWWDVEPTALYEQEMCGCKSCTRHEERGDERRKERRQGKKMSRMYDDDYDF